MTNIQEKPAYISREEKNGLTQELLKEYFDYKDGFLYWKKKSGRKILVGDKVGTITFRYDYRHRLRLLGEGYITARIIFFWHNGWVPEHIDHIDRNPINNKIENLRASNPLLNQMNKTSARGSSSQYLGVCFNKQRKKWEAGIRINKKQKFLGRFNTEAEAALAYNEAAMKYFGDFANLNIIKI